MGLYDTVTIPCPTCGELYYAQSKGSNKCRMRDFEFSDTPNDVMSDINRYAPFECEECGTIFDVIMQIIANTRVLKRKGE